MPKERCDATSQLIEQLRADQDRLWNTPEWQMEIPSKPITEPSLRARLGKNRSLSGGELVMEIVRFRRDDHTPVSVEDYLSSIHPDWENTDRGALAYYPDPKEQAPLALPVSLAGIAAD